MLFSQIAINFSLYIGALLSIFLNRKNFISVLIGMELLLLSINLNFIFISFYLNDISGYVKGIEGFENKFKEGYQNINQKDVFEYTLMKNKGATGYMQFLWVVNLIGIGAFLYFINNK